MKLRYRKTHQHWLERQDSPKVDLRLDEKIKNKKKVNRYFQILIFIFSYQSLFCQEQIGNDILGENINDDFGSGIAINGDGTIIAIGAQRRNSGQGIVEVYKYENGQWGLLGNKIEGPTNNALFGNDVALTPSGKRLIIGSYNKNVTRIYDFEEGEWSLAGEIALGDPYWLIHFGHAVDISKDGATVAVSATHYPQTSTHRGIVNIYREINNEWIQLGEGIEGEADGDQSGWDIDLSENGNKIAIGSTSNNNNGEDAGQVRVFSYDNSSWNQVGQSLLGDHAHLSFGQKISMSENGKYLIVGAPTDWTGVSTDYHYAEVFEFNDDEWTRKGDRIYGNLDENFGYDVEISDDGNSVVISVPQNDICPIQVFDFIDNQWELTGSITVEEDFHNFGFSIAINPGGSVLVGTSRVSEGFAKVYSLAALNKPKCLEDDQMEEEEIEDSLKIYVPNVIKLSANSSENSVFYVQSKYDIDYSFKIFDRWGRLIFENGQAITNKASDGWLPTHETIQGAYMYLVRMKNGESELLLKKGDVILIK